MTRRARGVGIVVTTSAESDGGVIASLEEQRDRRLSLVATMEASFADMVEATQSSNADDEHDPEGATIAFERTQLGAQIDLARADLGEIEQALVRAHTGDYGTCQSCGNAIAPGRLEARPMATTCITCASR